MTLEDNSRTSTYGSMVMAHSLYFLSSRLEQRSERGGDVHGGWKDELLVFCAYQLCYSFPLTTNTVIVIKGLLPAGLLDFICPSTVSL
jgi:hypothetical protein